MPIDFRTTIGTEATPEATHSIEHTFPHGKEATSFIGDVKEKLGAYGFQKGNCIAIVSTCRDEASRILDVVIAKEFGLIFNLHGLAGVPAGGVLAMKAGCSHSPVDDDGRERYVFFGITHIGVDEHGTIGKMRRIGRPKPSGACGALHFLSSLIAAKDEGKATCTEDDAEVFYLRQKIEAKGPEGNIIDVTNATVEVINDTYESLIAKTVDTSKADYAVITGVQIHTGKNMDGESFTYKNVAEWFVPSKGYVVMNGERTELL